MSDTKACSLTKYEIEALIKHHGFNLNAKFKEETIERINYLNKRLKAFKEVEYKDIEKTVTQQEQSKW